MFSEKELISKFPIFAKNHRLTPLETFNLLPLTNQHFYRLEWPLTKLNIVKHFLYTCFPEKEIISKFLFFDKNHGLTPLERINFFAIYKCTFSSSKVVCILLSTSLNSFSTPNMFKKEQFQNFEFFTKTMAYPLWKGSIF